MLIIPDDLSMEQAAQAVLAHPCAIRIREALERTPLDLGELSCGDSPVWSDRHPLWKEEEWISVAALLRDLPSEELDALWRASGRLLFLGWPSEETSGPSITILLGATEREISRRKRTKRGRAASAR